MATNTKRGSRSYPRGILTDPYEREYVPGSIRVMTHEELAKAFPGKPLAEIPFMSQITPGIETEASRARWWAIVDALAKELGADPRPHPHFWTGLAFELMYRHVPAFRPRRRPGRTRLSPHTSFQWIVLAGQECARLQKAKPDRDVYRAIARKKQWPDPNGKGAERARKRVERALANNDRNAPRGGLARYILPPSEIEDIN